MPEIQPYDKKPNKSNKSMITLPIFFAEGWGLAVKTNKSKTYELYALQIESYKGNAFIPWEHEPLLPIVDHV